MLNLLFTFVVSFDKYSIDEHVTDRFSGSTRCDRHKTVCKSASPTYALLLVVMVRRYLRLCRAADGDVRLNKKWLMWLHQRCLTGKSDASSPLFYNSFCFLCFPSMPFTRSIKKGQVPDAVQPHARMMHTPRNWHNPNNYRWRTVRTSASVPKMALESSNFRHSVKFELII